MALNVLIDNLIDMIFLLGNIFDFIWKANLRNLELLESHISSPQKVTWQSRVVIGLIVLILLVILTETGCMAYKILVAVWNWVTVHIFT